MGRKPQHSARGSDRRSPKRQDTWARYRDNLARHLIGISRDLESRVIRTLEDEYGYTSLRPSFGPFLSLIWDEGLPLSVVADELAISNQGCSQLATLVEEAGYLQRKPHPKDRRSKVVSLTKRGRALVEDGVRLILKTESEYGRMLAVDGYREFTSALAELYRSLELPTHGDAALVERAGQSIGVLPLIAVRVQRELMQATIARGHAGLKMSHGQILPLIGSEGGRIFEIARIQGVSRQAISTISKDLEALGYLRREADPRDRRGVVLKLTQQGEALIEDSVAALTGLEYSFSQRLGPAKLLALEHRAAALYRSLGLENAVFEVIRDPSDPSNIHRYATPASDRQDLRDLADRLRSQLGSGGAARLAALLEP